MTKDQLLASGSELVKAFCERNGLINPPVRVYGKGEWRFDSTCAYYRPVGIHIAPFKCAHPGTAGRAWSWPGYVIDRTPHGVMAHELGHHVDHTLSSSKGAYGGDFSSKMREQYQKASAKRNLFSSLTERQDPKSYKPEAEKLVKMSEEGIARFISNSEQDAALQYDAFICKMVSKVGDVTDASITGEHVWGHSILTVTKRDGSSERWKTQQIVNYSVYGRPYLQWPSRIVK